MARINLLPWRDAERQLRRLEFAIAGGCALGVALLVAVGVHLLYEGWISAQQARNQYIEEQISQLNRQIKDSTP